VGNQNRHQNDYRDINLPTSPGVLPSLIAGTTSYNTVLAYKGFGEIKLSENAQNAHYNALQVEMHSKIRNDLTLQAAYTLSRSIDPATSGLGGDLYTVSNPYDRAYDIGPSQGDRTHIAFVNFVYSFRSSGTPADSNAPLWALEMSGIVAWGPASR